MTPDELPPGLAAWCGRHLGAAPDEVFFTASSMSRVYGVRLADGRAVALKGRAAGPWLDACAAVQAACAAAGVGAPRLLAGPAPLALESPAPAGPQDEAFSAEEWLAGGQPQPGDDVPGRFGRLGARLVHAAAGVVDPAVLRPSPWWHYDHDATGRIWPPAASDRWDPHRIEADLPPALPALARAARARLQADDAQALPLVVGHGDLNGLNTRWTQGPARGWDPVVHDWDSVVARPEAALAGGCALDFVCTEVSAMADLAQSRALLAAWADERGRPWSAVEQQVAWAAGLWVGAYNAAFEHLHGGPGPITQRLLVEADERLRRAGASLQA